MSLYKQGVILYIYKKIHVYIPYIYTHTYIYVKQQDLCVVTVSALLTELLVIRTWSAVEFV